MRPSIVSGSALKQMIIPEARIAARFRGSTTTPPPVAITVESSAHNRSRARRSRARNSGSPKRPKMSATVIPASRSISTSASTNCLPRRLARAHPTRVLPVAMKPVRKTLFMDGYSPVLVLTDLFQIALVVPLNLEQRVAAELLQEHASELKRDDAFCDHRRGRNRADVRALDRRDRLALRAQLDRVEGAHQRREGLERDTNR